MFFQFVFNTVLICINYVLLSYAFYLASISCRHFNFAVGTTFLIAPYAALSLSHLAGGWSAAVPLAILSCGLIGLLYRQFASWLYQRGSRSGQLLLISLSVLAIVQNALAFLFGSRSRSLWPTDSITITLRLAHVTVTLQHSVVIFSGGALAIAVLIFWRWSVIGKVFSGLIDSRQGLELRGYHVGAIESLGTMAGFILAGVAGVLQAIDARIRPSMGLEATLIGVVTFIVGPMVTPGPLGLLLGALIIALTRLCLVLVAQAEWGMVAPLIVLLIAFAIRSVIAAISSGRRWR